MDSGTDNTSVESEESTGGLVGAWITCLVFCSFTFTMFYVSLVVWKGGVLILISGFFAAFGAVSLVYTIRQTIGRNRFGAVRLLLELPPPSIGGRLTGSVAIPPSAAGAPTLVAALTCYRDSYKGGEDAGWSSDAVWCGKHSFPIHASPGGRSAAIAIDIPADLEPTRPKPPTITADPGDPPRIFWNWKLRVTADLPGVNLDRSYPIVVLPAQPGVAPASNALQKGFREQAEPAARKSPVRGERDSSSVWALVAANLVPVAGAVFWGWHVEDIVFLYWIENLVIGAFNLPRILLAQPELGMAAARARELSAGTLLAGKAMFAMFFLVHYGVFCFAHGEFLLSMFPGVRHAGGLFAAVSAVLHEKGMMLAVFAIVASRGYSFLRNYIGRREYEGVDLKDLMFRPYKRIMVTHLFIIVGGFMLQAMKLPAVALVIFIALKIGADVYYHRAEREALA